MPLLVVGERWPNILQRLLLFDTSFLQKTRAAVAQQVLHSYAVWFLVHTLIEEMASNVKKEERHPACVSLAHCQ